VEKKSSFSPVFSPDDHVFFSLLDGNAESGKIGFFFVTESSKSFSFFTAFFSFFLRKGHVANFIDHQTQLHHLLEHLE
jgi:hypothetical protein